MGALISWLVSHHVARVYDAPCAPSPMQAVTFLKKVKEVVEDPRRILIDA